ncbi:MAG: aromatic ring-opening dioxygenase [Sphingomonas sp.]|uniref:DOPA 4,5-dioxygenase family protein n=1 Tax=Sphingomonas sp. TaxID=28214 RepID=UPI00121D99D1|nr:DOPA 4,5-dioxygenase family protein [Sphingomonas sp.]THD36980.1 MAG: aromatic ring-opening dioxygenase [Sphingomonas sp.]
MTGANDNAPWHAHIYYEPSDRDTAEALRGRFAEMMTDDELPILFVGRMTDRPVGPHPIPQFEIHFPASAGGVVTRAIEQTGLRALIHPLTDDDVADHTSLGHWIGEPLALDLAVLDPPGENKGVKRFGKSDF